MRDGERTRRVCIRRNQLTEAGIGFSEAKAERSRESGTLRPQLGQAGWET
jgi:hypothetical protein